ncbi:hypothetical protein Zmor_023420 [Zophobas morio]|uniref:THAP-type domain-containing protein n=2 Tax=Zophobas morio TaxID=2755281 RepID=A0AA38M7B8_9CUCU|nr:hypothetical protein Zmor_023420 [Zophobas morio]
MAKQCFFVGCDNNSTNNPEKLFLTVPQKVDRRKLWFEAVGRTYIPGKSLYCCEDHFDLEKDAENWIHFKLMGTRLMLKDNVVPRSMVRKETSSQFTPTSRKRKMETQQHSRGLRRKLFPEPTVPGTSQDVTEDVEELQLKTVASPSGMFVSAKSPEKSVSPLRTKRRTLRKATQTRVSTKDQSSMTSVEVADKSTNTLRSLSSQIYQSPHKPIQGSSTSLSSSSLSLQSGSVYEPSSESLHETNMISKELLVKVEIFKIENNSRFYLGLPKSEFFFIKLLQEELEVPVEHIYIVLKKIRTDDQFVRLGTDFALSTSGVSNIFSKTLPKMATKLNELIFWPEKSKIQRVLPRQFQTYYKDVEAIIDCFEIQVERPSAAYQQALTWSNYKTCNTCKYLVSSTPNGLINFISEGFGGRTSDVEIIKQSGYLTVVPENATVMTDRGFKQVAGLFQKKKVNLVRPPSVTSTRKMTKDEVRQSKLVAALRIHIERLIRRIREFRMLGPHATTDHNLVPLLDHIVIVACGLINLQGPLIQ